ncbi:MAG: small subunit ribosomal protein S7 [Candidatus Berkelbacteria bacterium Licking1014_7]|uniref:Small ribosomal subunit protein uS7 n=1 Tax=Candidatus Berkelbacteria bacterium Licking1014_7 TaxID=2017147 RepID=A0A554LKK6_9BACT|nr:MAG: small subunit ribosomal protein S7 [Candidatus Berkelbacteria bacterium Licking1014_7]
MRKAKFKKRQLAPDPRYNSILISQLINYVMKDGKKNTAKNIVYKALEIIEKKTKKSALEILQLAIKNTSPLLEVKSKRVGGATYQVPYEVRHSRQTTLSLRWILQAARAKQGKTFDIFLSDEILNASQKTGSAIQKKENMHKMAEANKAFAHFARF